MKKLLLGFLLLATLLPATNKTDQFNLSYWLYKPTSDQALLTTSSPTFAGLTLSGLTASTVVYSNASKALTSLANGAGYLLNDGSGGLSWGAVSFAGYLKADRSVALTGVTGPAMLIIDADEKFATVDGVAAGQVLVSAGTTTAPAYSASPTLTGNLSANNLTATPTAGTEIATMSGWTPTAGWTYSGVTLKWTHSSGTTALVDDTSVALVAGNNYHIVIGYTWAGAGSTLTITASGGNETIATITSAAASSVTYDFTCGAAGALTFTPTNGFTGTINSVSISIPTAGAVKGLTGQFDCGITLSNGSTLNPAIKFKEFSGNGLHVDTSGNLVWNNSGYRTTFTGDGVSMPLNTSFVRMGTNLDLTFRWDAAATLQMGTDAASPIDQTIKAHDGTGDNKVGAMLTLQGGQNTGAGAGGDVRTQTANTNVTAATAGVEYTRYRAVGKVVTLTDAGATDVVSFAVTAGNSVGGMLVYTINVYDDDASDNQVESGTVIFCGLQDDSNWHTNISEVSTQALESGTLATTWAIDTVTANTLKVTCLADSNLTTPVITLRYQFFLNSPIVETP